MAERLVSPDRRLFLIRDNADLEALAELHSMTKSQKGNIKQLLGWNLVGNHTGDRNDRNERKEAANWIRMRICLVSPIVVICVLRIYLVSQIVICVL